MSRIDFYISNRNHHWQMMWPVMQELKEKHGAEIRLVSLCEFRRMLTPVEELDKLRISYVILRGLKIKGTSTATGRKGLGGNKSPARNLLRELIWLFWLRPSLVVANRQLPKRVIVPNDVAFPFNKICRWLKKKKVPFILMQEGVRFSLPNEEGGARYGSMGAQTILCWGESSKAYFKGVAGKVALKALGNPRFDVDLSRNYSVIQKEILVRYSLGKLNVLYISNPVDDQGFCSHHQKMMLFSKFVSALLPYYENLQVKVIVRLHPREDRQAFRAIIDEQNLHDYVIFAQDYPLFAVLSLVDVTVILASTVGLESILLNTPVAVLELPGYGFVFDYVSSGVAYPIRLDGFSVADFINFAQNGKEQKRDAMRLYQENHVSNIGSSKGLIANEIINS